MKRLLLLLACVLACTVPLSAQYRYVAFEQITVAASAIGFTSATISDGSGHPQANSASCRLETAQIRFTVDGTTPTSTVGTLLEVGDWLTLTSPDLVQNFRAIRTGGTSATTGGLAGWGARDTSTNTSVATGYSTASATTGITTSNPAGGVASITPAGTISAPVFSGNAADNRSAFRKVIFCRKT